MPLITATAQAVQMANIFEVLEIDILNNTPPQIRIYWRYGTRDAAGVVEWAGNLNKVYDATALGAAKPDGTKTWYGNVKALAYTMLVGGGDIPAVGAVS